MGPAYFVMVLIGCGTGQDCAPVATMPVAYRSQASCLADRSSIIAASSDLGFQRLIAECHERPKAALKRARADSTTVF